MSGERRALAVAFMRLPPTTREQIARDLGVGDDLPDWPNKAGFVILRRVREGGLIDDLAAALTAIPSHLPGGEVGRG